MPRSPFKPPSSQGLDRTCGPILTGSGRLYQGYQRVGRLDRVLVTLIGRIAVSSHSPGMMQGVLKKQKLSPWLHGAV